MIKMFSKIATSCLMFAVILVPVSTTASAQMAIVRAAEAALDFREAEAGFGRSSSFGRSSEPFSKFDELQIRNPYRSAFLGAGVVGAGLSKRNHATAPSSDEDFTKRACSDELMAPFMAPSACGGLPLPRRLEDTLKAVNLTAEQSTSKSAASAIATSSASEAAPASEIDLSDIQGVCDESAPTIVRNRASRSLLQALLKTASKRLAPFDAQDAAQGTLYKLLEHCPRVLGYSNPVRGVYGILRFAVVDTYRAKMRADQLEDRHSEYFPSFDPTESYENADLMRRLYAGLTPRQREVLAGIYADMSGPALARELSISADRVKEIRSAISKKLKCLVCEASGQQASENP